MKKIGDEEKYIAQSYAFTKIIFTPWSQVNAAPIEKFSANFGAIKS